MLEKGSRQSFPGGLDKISQARSALSSRDDGGKCRGVIFAVQPLFCIGICMKDINTLYACKSEIAACWALAKEKGFDFAACFHCWSKSLNLSSSRVIKLSVSVALCYFCSVLLSFLRVDVGRRTLDAEEQFLFYSTICLVEDRLPDFPAILSPCELDAALLL